ncbi:MAG: ABC transporter permease [Firmicutes bacterium]|nr:ABC transporter permease [Bacillota bacterium]
MENISKGQREYMEALERNKRRIRLAQIVILLAFFALWELTAQAGILDPFIFSSPSRILTCLIQMSADGSLFRHIGITLFETCAGFVSGTALGTFSAVILWWNSSLRKILDPYLVVLNSLPKTALAPIIIVWIGNNMSSIIVTALLTSVIVTLLSVLAGFMAVEEDKILLARTFGATKPQILRYVVFPASVPAIINALKINVGLSFVGVMVGEFLVAGAGLGYLIVYGSQVFKLDWVMLSVLILAVLAALMYKWVAALEKKFTKRWKEKE